jgi:hypothetical protein
LKQILKILGEKDRICLISYNSEANILTPFLRLNNENKIKLKKEINLLKGG